MSRYRYLLLYWGGCLFELAKAVLIVLIVGVLVHFFVITLIPINGDSMLPNIESRDWVVLDKISYINHQPQRGDVVAVRFPGDREHERYIKRIIGLPGDWVRVVDGSVYINDRKLFEVYLPEETVTTINLEVKLEADQYFLMGDNRKASSDSRLWGPVTSKEIMGKARFVLWPPKHYKPIIAPGYSIK